MRLIKVTGHHSPYRTRYFADGKPVSRARYEELRDNASIRDCFLTEKISIAGGFLGFRHSQEVR